MNEKHTPGQVVITAEYSPSFGFQCVLHRDGTLIGRYGNFNTEAEALRTAVAAIAKATGSGA